jgi:hypothetical protein
VYTPHQCLGADRLPAVPLNAVRLLPSRFQQNMQRDSAWMMSIPVNSLLHSFRTQAGVFSSREGGYMTMARLGGWESLDCDLRGHITGHLLSALATLYAQTGSAAVKAKADSLVAGLNEVQQARAPATSVPSARAHRPQPAGQECVGPMVHPPQAAQGLIDQYRLCGSEQPWPWPVAWAFGPTGACTR